MEAYGLSVPGAERPSNEDRFLIGDFSRSLHIRQSNLEPELPERVLGQPHGEVLVVADGISGQPRGEEASRIAVQTILAYITNILPWAIRLRPGTDEDLLDELQSALRICEKTIREKDAREQGALDTAAMGAALTMAYVLYPTLYVVHAGHTRCYLHREGHLEQLTTDQTYAEKLAEADVLSPAAARTSRWNNVLHNVLGGDQDTVRPEVHRVHLQGGDRVLLCTDGLSNHLDDGALQQALAPPASPREAAEGLVRQAAAAGAADNTTAVVAAWPDPA